MAELEQLRAGVIARLAWLRQAQVLHGPCELHPLDQPRGLPSPAALLWDWSRLISDVQRLLDAVLEPALREPGRLHQRRAAIERGRPRGAVHWPRTAALALRSVDAGGLRFVCSAAARSLLAPENLLLVWTLDELLEAGLLLSAEAGPLLGRASDDPARRLRAHLRAVEGSPEFTSWREAARALRRSGTAALRGLEQAVRERLRGRPSAAPDWARTLLELRTQPAAVPSRSAIASIDAGTLWQQFAALELLCGLRRAGALRQVDDGFVGARGLRLRGLAGTPAWVLAAPEREPVGVLWPLSEDWREVQMQALYCCFNARHETAQIDRWLILHRSGEAGVVRRHAIELRYVDVRSERELGSDYATLAELTQS